MVLMKDLAGDGIEAQQLPWGTGRYAAGLSFLI